MTYHPLLRANKGQAPTAGQYNRLAENLETVLAQKGPRFFLANKTVDQVVVIPSTGVGVNLTFTNEVLDPFNMFSAGTITVPSDAKLLRMVCNIVLSAQANIDLSILMGGSTFQVGYVDGASTNGDGIRAINLDTGWYVWDGSTPSSQINVNSVALTGFTVSASTQTWISLEVL